MATIYILSIDIDDCDPNPCQNGGECNDGIHSYSCNCALGYDGINCDTSKYILYLVIPILNL